MGKTDRSFSGIIPGIVAAAAMLLSCHSFADDPYADYVKLTRKDTKSNYSWNVKGGWSDKQEPHSDANYYVAPGAILWRIHNLDADDRKWKGGRLVLAGTFHSAVSASDANSPVIPDLVLLGGSEVRAETYGPFYSVGDVTGVVTVAGTAENPSKITQHYSQSGTRSHRLYAKFVGTADSMLEYTRPFTNYSGTVIDHGFYARALKWTFANYPGTFRVTGGNSVFKPDSNYDFNWPQTAFVVDDGAELYFYYGNTYNNSTKNAYLRSFTASGATLYFTHDVASRNAFPVLNVTERLALENGTTIRLNSDTLDTFIVGISDTNPTGRSKRLFHVADTAAATLGDLSGIKLKRFNGGGMPFTNVSLEVVSNLDGSKDVYIASPGIVAMTNGNVETTGYGGGSNPADAPQYGAFEPGHPNDWSNGVTPPADSALQYCAVARFCCFQPIDMPNATMTLAIGSSWKGGESIRFKEFNILAGYSFGIWGSPKEHTLTAERLNIVDSGIGASATIYAGQLHTLDVDAELCGSGNLIIRNMNDQGSYINFGHINTNFHGRFSLTQNPTTNYTRYLFTSYLGDARNWGGQYTASDSTYNSITLSRFPKVAVTNDVTFADPTRGIFVSEGAKFDVSDGKTLRLANQVTYAGILEKDGAGTLDLAGVARFINGKETTAPVAETNVLNILAGALKVSSKTAADGLAVTFSEGTRLIVPADTEAGYFNVKWDAPLAIDTTDGTLPVVIEPVADMVGDVAVPICTFNATAAADIPETAFSVKKMANGFRQKSPVTKSANMDGSVSYVVTMGKVGTQLLVR